MMQALSGLAGIGVGVCFVALGLWLYVRTDQVRWFFIVISVALALTILFAVAYNFGWIDLPE